MHVILSLNWAVLTKAALLSDLGVGVRAPLDRASSSGELCLPNEQILRISVFGRWDFTVTLLPPGWASITVEITRKPCPVNSGRSPDPRTRNVT